MRQATAESALCAALSSNAYETSTLWTIPAIGLDTKTWLAVMVFGMSRSCMVVLEKCIIGDIQKKKPVSNMNEAVKSALAPALMDAKKTHSGRGSFNASRECDR